MVDSRAGAENMQSSPGIALTRKEGRAAESGGNVQRDKQHLMSIRATGVSEALGILEHLSTVSGTGKWYNSDGKQYGDLSKN
jgi:hypothetical protein